MRIAQLIGITLVAGAVSSCDRTKSVGASGPDRPDASGVDASQTEAWPSDPTAQWPPGCLIENVAAHPTERLLAAACTEPDDGSGAVLILDLETAELRSVTEHPEMVGWPGRRLLHWHPDGDRLVTNVSTSAIGIVDRTGFVATALPDDGRDHGVRSLWVGDQLFADTGALIDVKPSAPHDWLPETPTGAPWFYRMAWNDELRAVVGRTEDAIVAFDVTAKKIVHRTPAGERVSQAVLSADGKWFVEQRTSSPKPIEIVMFQVGPGGQSWTFAPTGQTVRAAPAWGPDGRLAVYSTDYDRERDPPYVRPRLDLAERGKVVRTISFDRAIEASWHFEEVPQVQWSPSGEHLAALVEDQRVHVFDYTTGKRTHDFAAPASPPPAGRAKKLEGDWAPHFGRPGVLLWASADHLVRLDSHFLSVWTLDGRKVGEVVMPDAPSSR